MSSKIHADDLTAVVRYALETTRATIVCPFHDRVIIRVGDDAAESHAFERAKRIIKSDGEFWASDVLGEEFGRQLGAATDGRCPECDRRDPGT
ncbi:hypothetical protein CDS [Bradyrhizobium sp.]|uniref:hypothetical protein n=1 Tax=unclassified Bradyrhizobium TaxID=2631580 RepID=UPI0007C1854C|nr:hypothetical protein [Bradyrhizobium sp.]CUU17740.1 hypothetical protein CDS [Bradyrhizobium sp.]